LYRVDRQGIEPCGRGLQIDAAHQCSTRSVSRFRGSVIRGSQGCRTPLRIPARDSRTPVTCDPRSGTRESNAVSLTPKVSGLTVSLVPGATGDCAPVVSCHPLWSSQRTIPPGEARGSTHRRKDSNPHEPLWRRPCSRYITPISCSSRTNKNRPVPSRGGRRGRVFSRYPRHPGSHARALSARSPARTGKPTGTTSEMLGAATAAGHMRFTGTTSSVLFRLLRITARIREYGRLDRTRNAFDGPVLAVPPAVRGKGFGKKALSYWTGCRVSEEPTAAGEKGRP
jgi:hypothetical protein